MMTLEEAIKHCEDVALSCTNKECALEHFQLLKWLQEYSNILKRHDEQKPIIEMKSPEESLGISSKEYNEIVNGCIYGESKPADSLESKFEVGKWIIDKESKEVFYIRKNLANTYEIVDIEGNDYYVPHYTLEEDYDVWTIRDAKDGDVLFQDLMGGKTFIYNGVNHDMAILYSFIISNDGEDVLSYHIGKPNTGIGFVEENKNIIHPATKEQRDLLLAKMKEEGYGWDAENKKVKIIDFSKHLKYTGKAPSLIEDGDFIEELAYKLQELLGGNAAGARCLARGWARDLLPLVK